MLDIFLKMILPYPKSILLIAVGSLQGIWLLYLILIKKYQTRIFQAYLIFSVCIICWVFGNAYAESALFTAFGGTGLKVTFAFVGIFTTLSLTAFFYLSCLLKSGKNQISKKNFSLLTFLVVQNFFFFLTPHLAIQQAEVFEDGTFQLIQGDYFFLFYVVTIFVIVLGARNILTAFHSSRNLERQKLLWVAVGISVMYGSSIIFHMIYPYITNDYSYSFIPPTLSILHVFIVGYGIFSNRFHDFHYNSSRFLKWLFSLTFSFVVVLGLRQFQVLQYDWFLVLIAVVAFLTAMTFFYSNLFYRIFQPTSFELMKVKIQELKNKESVYSQIEMLEFHITEIFCKELKITFAHLIIQNLLDTKKYSKLIAHCEQNREIIVLKELEFAEEHEEKHIPFLKEIQELGEILLPLYNTSQKFLGFLALGKKRSGLYSQEEIELIAGLQNHLDLELTGLLFQSFLQEEVEKKTQELTNIIDQQTAFIANTAHEIRTPSAGLIFNLEGLKDFDLPDEAKEILEVCLDSGERLHKIIRALFEVQSYDLGQVELDYTKINVFNFIQDIFEKFAPFMKEKSIQFCLENKVSTTDSLCGDSGKILKVLEHLLKNAEKFVPQSAKVTLRAEREGKFYRFKVIDNGKGLPFEMKTNVFERFRTKNAYGGEGIGLGLYISKKIVELHDGRIWAEDTVEGGATFVVELPK